MVSISGRDPLDPGPNPGRANLLLELIRTPVLNPQMEKKGKKQKQKKKTKLLRSRISIPVPRAW